MNNTFISKIILLIKIVMNNREKNIIILFKKPQDIIIH